MYSVKVLFGFQALRMSVANYLEKRMTAYIYNVYETISATLLY